jgi:hypothetical protein
VCDEPGQIIGYIVLLTALASTHSNRWMWMIDSAFHDGRDKTHGFGATREDALDAFTHCWFPVRQSGASKADDHQQARTETRNALGPLLRVLPRLPALRSARGRSRCRHHRRGRAPVIEHEPIALPPPPPPTPPC